MNLTELDLTKLMQETALRSVNCTQGDEDMRPQDKALEVALAVANTDAPEANLERAHLAWFTHIPDGWKALCVVEGDSNGHYEVRGSFDSEEVIVDTYK